MCAKRNDYQIAIDDALTKHLNSHDAIHDYMVKCAAALNDRLKGDPRWFFYVKGSAALSRYLAKWSVPEQTIKEICARSDWDTQLVINPLLSRAEWFAAFQQCQATVLESLDLFEEGLLAVLKPGLLADLQVDPQLLAGKSDDPTIRRHQNELAKKLRDAIGEYFGGIFLDTCRREKFAVGDVSERWNLVWDNINALDESGKRKGIMELDIQAHSQATLTSALIHPAQTLDNLHSVMTGEQVRRLRQTTAATAEQVWTKVSAASDQYDQLRLHYISQTPEAVEFLRRKILELQSDLVVINSLPEDITTQTVEALHHQDKPGVADLWARVREARLKQLISGGGASPVEVDFGYQLIEALKQDRNQHVAQQLRKWCLDNMTIRPEVASQVIEIYHSEIVKLLSEEQRQQLRRLEAAIDEEFERYEEEPDPEDVAEAGRKDIEGLAPFALVAQEKGGRKVASILENMTIREFYLFRLMIRCQLSNRDTDHPLIPQAPPRVDFDTFKQQFKFRAELLDVSVPRDDSIETAEQWAHTRHQIAVDQGIPLPNGDYFMDEYILMFREVLDKKSSSAHKLTKRLKRACLIAGIFVKEQQKNLLWEERLRSLAVKYPPFEKVLSGLNVPAPNLALFMRMCEQLVQTYDLSDNEKLQADSTVMLQMVLRDLQEVLTKELTHETFLQMMRIYKRLGGQIYAQAFVLSHFRQKLISNGQLVQLANGLKQRIGKAFGDDDRRFRCAVVEDFAIAAEPDLPDSVRQAVPCDVLKLMVYTNDSGKSTLEPIVPQLIEDLKSVQPELIDAYYRNGVIYARIVQESGATPLPSSPQGGNAVGRAIFLKVEFVFDDNPENWVAPAHERDLRAIVKQYRRSLPRHTEYHCITQKKNILQQMETALTTY